MQNGLGLLGNSSSSQSAIILKKPNSNSIYYIFTADGWSGTQGGLNYSEVDMDLEGGLGAITANKNILLMPQTCEKVTAIKHQNESDFWVISRAENSNSYSTFLVTSNGVDLVPIVTNIGDVYSGTGGYMKGSPNGNRLAVANYFINNTFDLFDFDNSTGIMSNLSSISTPNDAMVYGIEFSPNNDIIYVATWPYGLYQFDLLGGSASSIINSVVDLNGLNNSIGLQIGPDDKIYITENGFSSLGVIENPNVLGAGCNYTAGAVSLGSGVSHLGLPTFFSSVFNTTTTLPTSCDSTATAIIRINSSSSSILDTSVCESFYWNDSLYTSSGLYTFSSSNSLGCDSIAELNLTIYNTTYNEDYQFHCDSYTWIDGNTYLAANNTATHIITNSLGCDSVITLKLNMPENNLIIPNTFTPNYDRKNEVFKIYSKSNVKDFEVWVYNKWGQEIFYSNEIDEGWNGFFKGALCPIGVYVYKLSYKCLGQQIIDTGSFFLMM